MGRGSCCRRDACGKGVIERDIEAKVPDRDKKLVLYCGGGFRSALAADNLKKWAIRMSSRWMADGARIRDQDCPVEK